MGVTLGVGMVLEGYVDRYLLTDCEVRTTYEKIIHKKNARQIDTTIKRGKCYLLE